MDEQQKQRHADLTATVHQVCPNLVRLVQDMIRSRSFRQQRDVIVGALDALADITDELEGLDKMVAEEGRAVGAGVKARVAAEREAVRRRLAAEDEAQHKRLRRDLEQAALRAGL